MKDKDILKISDLVETRPRASGPAASSDALGIGIVLKVTPGTRPGAHPYNVVEWHCFRKAQTRLTRESDLRKVKRDS
jgi:hypothetical protein